MPILPNLAFQILKQISKPLSRILAEQAREHPVFRNGLIIPLGQQFHRLEVKFRHNTMYTTSQGLSKYKSSVVPKLKESKAIESGVEILSELIIFCILACATIGISSVYSDENDQETEDEVESMEKWVDDLEVILELQNNQLKELSRTFSKIREELKFNEVNQ